MHNVLIDNRKKLLLAARELFLEQGYKASVDAIIDRAGVARQTFYNHFKSKKNLFAEAAKRYSLEVVVYLDGDAEDLRGSLIRFSQAYRSMMLSPDGIAFYRRARASNHP
ncbi:MAG: TetR/AcrR family transcriptional regulator [Azonexus sp.]|nr:TetR/AcrR family transcriptional regulator [Azonexus sp.]